MLAYNPRWTAIKLLEDDKIVKERILEKTGDAGRVILDATREQRRYLMDRFEDDPEIVTTDERYGFIAGIVKEVVTTSVKERVDLSRDIDLVLTNRFVGFPIFIFFIWAMFQLTFTLGDYPMGWLESGIGWFSSLLAATMPESLFKDLLLNGIIAGVGSVIVFLPNILILFFCIALFEDTGYMARAAFLMDKVMHLIGLHGKSFIPMLMGFGCNVPAIMATRTLESEKDRILTILITPFMSCSAKLPVYIVLAGTFFGPRAGTRHFRRLPAGDCAFHHDRPFVSLDLTQRGRCTVRDGTAPLPRTHVQKSADSHVGSQQDVFKKNGRHHSDRFGGGLGAVRFSPPYRLFR